VKASKADMGPCIRSIKEAFKTMSATFEDFKDLPVPDAEMRRKMDIGKAAQDDMMQALATLCIYDDLNEAEWSCVTTGRLLRDYAESLYGSTVLRLVVPTTLGFQDAVGYQPFPTAKQQVHQAPAPTRAPNMDPTATHKQHDLNPRADPIRRTDANSSYSSEMSLLQAQGHQTVDMYAPPMHR